MANTARLLEGADAHGFPRSPAPPPQQCARLAHAFWTPVRCPLWLLVGTAVLVSATTAAVCVAWAASPSAVGAPSRAGEEAPRWQWRNPTPLEFGPDEGVFLHFTDIHTEPYYDSTAPETVDPKVCRSYEPANCSHALSMEAYGAIPKVRQYQYGRIMCDGPWLLLKTALDTAQLVRKDPDFIVVTGDFPAHRLKCAAIIENVIANVTATVASMFPRALVVPTIGNNDLVPDYNMTVDPAGGPNDQLARLHDIWAAAGWLPADAWPTFSRGGFYNVTSPLSPRLRLVALNSILWSTKRRHGDSNALVGCPDLSGKGGDGADPAGQLMWLRSQLDDALALGQRVYLIAHIPPGSQKGDSPNYCAFYLDRLTAMVSYHRTVVAAMIFGHHHMDEFRLMWDERDGQHPRPYASVLIAPPVTTSDRNNPAFRAYVYNRGSAVLLDWIGYLLAMQKANYHGYRSWEPTAFWKEFYSMRRTFGATDMTAQSLAAVYAKMLSSEPALRTYMDHAYGHYIGDRDYMAYICDMRYVHRRTNAECKRLGREVRVRDHEPGTEPVLVSGAVAADQPQSGKDVVVPSSPG